MARLDGFMIWVEDVAATAAFYERAFDLTATQLDLENGFALLSTGGVDLQLAADVEAADRQAAAAGAEPVVPVTAKPWGQRVGCVRDLAGFLVELGSPALW